MSNVFKSYDVLLDPRQSFVLEKRMPVKYPNLVGGTFGSEESNQVLEEEMRQTLGVAQNEAEKIVEAAHKQAVDILARAKHDIEMLKTQAEQQGFQNGFEEGFKRASEEYSSTLEEAMILKRQMLKEKEELYIVFEQDMVKLAVEIAKKVIYERLEDDGEAYIRLVQSTIQKVQGIDSVKLWVSPADHMQLMDGRESLLSELKGVKNIEIFRGDSVKRWGCIADTDNGVLDGGLDTRLAQIEETLASVGVK